jgi:predicted 3-demethylubiquinone-9 3-methyltransferase (glyoxalase superfamily)
MQKITPFLWFDTQAEEAANFYVSVFKNAKILNVSHYGEEGQEVTGKKPGTVMVADFEIEGQRFQAINGGPNYKISPAISFTIDCKDQEEVDYYWSKLTEGGREVQCGWLEDKFGVSWQVVPSMMSDLFAGDDKEAIGRTMNAMLGMVKLDIQKLQDAYDGK